MSRVAEWLARGTHDLLSAGSRLTAATSVISLGKIWTRSAPRNAVRQEVGNV